MNCMKKSIDNLSIINAFLPVGVTGFEPATTRPPDVLTAYNTLIFIYL